MTKSKKRKIATLDFETDPFLYGRIPRPFAWGFFTDDMYRYHWQSEAWKDNKCVEKLLAFLESLDDPYLIYAHNGGKFDFLFFIEALQGSIKIVNGRILEAQIGIHTIRDSYAIMPIPLGKLGGKKEIDYKLMERDCREDHKTEILEYLQPDCESLYNAIVAFRNEFGDSLTIGSSAMRELKRFHTFDTASESYDKFFRQYYFGGRCQCFETGVIDTTVKGYDANSGYPDAMMRLLHPVSTEHEIVTKVSNKTSFVCWEGENYNAVPVRETTGTKGLLFDVPYGTFYTTIHEFNSGLETGSIKPMRIKHAIDFSETTTFASFVEHFYNSRLEAKARGDLFLEIFYKLILNSAYGKFAQSSDNFTDSLILEFGEFPPPKPEDISDEQWYRAEYTHNLYQIWSKPSAKKSFFNVATAASITGGMRANLLTALSKAIRPMYCDTDSIYCAEFLGETDSKRLGAWKLEFEGDQIAIAGKKLYAVMKDGECIKKASKGVRLHPLAIFMAARGDTVETRNDAPTFKLDGNHQFIERRVRKTGEKKVTMI